MQPGKAGLNVCRFAEGEELDIYGGDWQFFGEAAERDPDFVGSYALAGQNLDELKGCGADQGIA